MAFRAINVAIRFCGLGDLVSLDLRNDESSGPESKIRFINFNGNAQLTGQAPLAVCGRIVVRLDDSINRWVPVSTYIDTVGFGLAVGFGYEFDRDGGLILAPSYMHTSASTQSTGDEVSDSEPGRRL